MTQTKTLDGKGKIVEVDDPKWTREYFRIMDLLVKAELEEIKKGGSHE